MTMGRRYSSGFIPLPLDDTSWRVNRRRLIEAGLAFSNLLSTVWLRLLLSDPENVSGCNIIINFPKNVWAEFALSNLCVSNMTQRCGVLWPERCTLKLLM